MQHNMPDYLHPETAGSLYRQKSPAILRTEGSLSQFQLTYCSNHLTLTWLQVITIQLSDTVGLSQNSGLFWYSGTFYQFCPIIPNDLNLFLSSSLLCHNPDICLEHKLPIALVIMCMQSTSIRSRGISCYSKSQKNIYYTMAQ